MKLSGPMIRALKHLHSGGKIGDILRGRSMHGGWRRTWWALRERGLMTRDEELTKEGHRVAAELESINAR